MMSILKGFCLVACVWKESVMLGTVYEKEGLIASSCLPEMWETHGIERKNRQSLNDGFEWMCRNQSSVKEENHYVSRSVRKGYWFQLSNMDMCTVLLVMRKWFEGAPSETCGRRLGCWFPHGCRLVYFCREVCIHVLIRDSCKIGGKWMRLLSVR
ncbi:hypothetical protein TNCV_4115941 [Trichonephila clavipes]|nr:hypothetical protein TNCV_4115941 [Trichonephila clavipes]